MYSPPSKENEKEAPNKATKTKPASTSAVQHKGTGYSAQHASLSPDSQDFAEQRQALEPVQMKDGASTEGVHAAAEAGTQGAGGSLPHLDTIQKSFGSHDVSSIQAYTGGAATEASQSMGAKAYATGNKVAFGSSPSLHTAAHEAAHVVQQRAGVVSLKGGVGQSGDAYEKHADAVADAVVAGKSAEPILNKMAEPATLNTTRSNHVQKSDDEPRTIEAPEGGEAAFQQVVQSYLNWVLANCVIPDDSTFKNVVRFGFDPKKTLELRHKNNPPPPHDLDFVGEVAERCAGIPVMASVMSWFLIGVGVVVTGGTAAAGASLAEIAWTGKWVFDLAAKGALKMTHNSDYDGFEDWLYFQLRYDKFSLMDQWARESGVELTSDLRQAIQRLLNP